MWLVNQTSTAARTALIYVTAGALTVIWTGLWYVYLFNNPPTGNAYYWCTGFLVTGLTLVLIGLGLGRIGRSAQPADLPPKEVPVTVVNLQPNAAPPSTPVLASQNLTTPVVAPSGRDVFAPPLELAGTAGEEQLRV